jgi:hypothetical protein
MTATAAGILGLLAALPARAAEPSFTVHFDSAQISTNPPPASGVKGSAIFTFTSAGLELTLSNDTDTAQASELVAMAFQVPDGITAINTFTRAGWNTLQPGGSLPSLPEFDVCQSISSDCTASGSPNAGLDSGDSALVTRFTLSGLGATASLSDYRAAFVAQGPSSFAMRLKGIDDPQIPGPDTEGSDTLTGYLIKTPGQAPGDAVPGPVPILGAAAAFGYSRRLRQRLKAQSAIQ